MKNRLAIFIVLLVVSLVIYSHSKMSQNNPQILSPLLSEIESHIPKRVNKNHKISQVDVAWQLDHSLKTINRITEALATSNPEEYDISLNAARTISLTAGYIPRGRAQSPDIVKPPEIISTKDIYQQLEEARNNILILIELNENTNFEHPYFGQLNKAQAIRFIEVHTKHHLKIIREIIGNH